MKTRLSQVQVQGQRRSSLLTMVAGILGSTILFWLMVQLGQASSESKPGEQSTPQGSSKHEGAPSIQDGEKPETNTSEDTRALAPPTMQGPAIDVPREVLDMLDQRKRDLDRREAAIHQNEERLVSVRTQIEELLNRNEALEKRIQDAQAHDEGSPAQQAKAKAEKQRVAQEQKAQLAKIYEAMPSEDAAARLERMPDRKAIEILRMVKAKTAGAILAQVKTDRAARLTEQLMAQTP